MPFGEKIVKDRNLTTEAVLKAYGKQTPSERELVKIGIVNQIMHKIGSKGDTTDLTKYFLETPNMRKNAALYLGKEDMRRVLAKRGRESVYSSVRSAIEGNSKTIQRGRDTALVGASGGALYGGYDPVEFAKGASVAALGKVGVSKVSARLSQRIAEALLSNSPETARMGALALKKNPALEEQVRKIVMTPMGVGAGHQAVQSMMPK